MSKYSGIDLHPNNCVVAVIDNDDRVCRQKRRKPRVRSNNIHKLACRRCRSS
jgi:hypothetical protein